MSAGLQTSWAWPGSAWAEPDLGPAPDPRLVGQVSGLSCRAVQRLLRSLHSPCLTAPRSPTGRVGRGSPSLGPLPRGSRFTMVLSSLEKHGRLDMGDSCFPGERHAQLSAGPEPTLQGPLPDSPSASTTHVPSGTGGSLEPCLLGIHSMGDRCPGAKPAGRHRHLVGRGHRKAPRRLRELGTQYGSCRLG